MPALVKQVIKNVWLNTFWLEESQEEPAKVLYMPQNPQ